MADVSRRGFLQLFASAVALSATVGVASIPAEVPESAQEFRAAPLNKLRARHLCQYDVTTHQIIHRLDVIVNRTSQYGVDFTCPTKTPTAQELEPALELLANHIEHEHGERFEFEIRSFGDAWSIEASQWLGRFGEAA